MGSVSIKGTGSGIILELDGKCTFEELKTDVAGKFRESSSFLGKASMGLMTRGRIMSDDEVDEIVRIITENSKLTINCVLTEDPVTDQLFLKYQSAAPESEVYADTTNEITESQNIDALIDDINQSVAEEYVDKKFASIHKGSLRSGQSISEKNSIIIMGDVKPGATVTSDGNIYVLGALRGSAYAGADGDEKALVFALEMDPLQIRIANAIAISPDADKGPKLKQRKFRKKVAEKEAEIAYILNGHVVKDVYGQSFMRGNRLG
ncbi:MAG: hypothetical protein E7302_11800 [Butyrivibrio sp.]|nr:hypothetical protein [Butyrivibrio sp.]